ncbi:hypothetical protein [Jeotgalibacillus campisalis]|uniref:Flagellar hook-length control protein-like C-terminal domain-containing protein n=1 Tax=Jeotgalibacillus campisalis TaxID=220754 RepID=A0A0C2RMK4_9BACL|nr:hypothetical protein [Jeotgalibacillus campisalis]KIL42984.1 hypothetical protein KR50_33880 [Jeotgalibacillus campisalis]
MQVNIDPAGKSYSKSDVPTAVQKGDLLQVTIKEKHVNGEATVHFRGRELKVKVEGDLPSSGKTSVEVTGSKDGMPVIKQAEPPVKQAVKPSSEQQLTALNGGKPVSSDIKAAAQILLDKGIPVNKQVLQELTSFISKSSGDVSLKLYSVTAAAQKQLDMTSTQLHLVHNALHGKTVGEEVGKLLQKEGLDPALQSKLSNAPKQLYDAGAGKLAEVLQTLSKKFPDHPVIKQLTEALKNGSSLKQIADTLQAQFSSELTASSSLSKKVSDAVKLEALMVSKMASLSLHQSAPIQNPSDPEQDGLVDALQKAIRLVQKNPDMHAVLKEIQQSILPSEHLPENLSASIKQAVDHASAALDKGRELSARQEVMQVLQQAHTQLKPQHTAGDEGYQLSEQLAASLPAQSKDFIVTRISEKLSQAAIDFKQIKRDITRNLQQMDQLLLQQQRRAVPQVKPMLENTIKMLDQAILKSDFMLYTDMATEKKLLKGSSQLAEAARLVAKGQTAEAAKVVSEVKFMMEKINFKPADVRVQHMVSTELLQLDPPSISKQAATSVSHSMNMVHQEPTGRQLFEHVRGMGLTHEHEQSHALLTKGKPQEELSASLKSMLLKMVHEEGEKSGVKSDSMLNQITGQQLLSKTDASGLQSMVMTLPYLLENKVEEFKVFLQSKSGEQKVDWENCSLYFLFETKKLGEVGIALTANERMLSIKVKNDLPGFEEKMKPLTALAKSRLEDIGYEIGSIQFTKLLKESVSATPQEEKERSAIPAMSEKGFDFSI